MPKECCCVMFDYFTQVTQGQPNAHFYLCLNSSWRLLSNWEPQTGTQYNISTWHCKLISEIPELLFYDVPKITIENYKI